MSVRKTRHRVPLVSIRAVLAALYLIPGITPALAANMEQMQQSTVRILCETEGGRLTGSGFVVGGDNRTYVATNHHVAMCAKPGSPERLVIFLGPNDLVPVQVVWSDAEKDLAILSTSRSLGRPAVEFADTASVAAGAKVTVVGFPGAADEVVKTDDNAIPSVTGGNVSRVITAKANGVRYFQHSAATNPGNSGGPVYDEAGHVIGVNSLKALTFVAGISRGQVSLERVANGEGIAGAVDVAELLPHLRAVGVPYTMASTFTTMDISIIVLAAALALLLGASGILFATPSGRQLLFRRRPVQASRSRAVNVQVGRIRILDGSLAGMDVPLTAKVILGRDPGQAQVIFPEGDAAVSRRHCEISFDDGAGLFEIRDLGSRNGTFIASGTDKPRRMAPDVVERVGPGQKILIGSPRNRLVLELG